jgi:hypothetical protein
MDGHHSAQSTPNRNLKSSTKFSRIFPLEDIKIRSPPENKDWSNWQSFTL